MKKLILLLVLGLSSVSFAQGQSDTTTLSDYISSFFIQAGMGAYTTPWDIDPDTSNIRQAINDALLDVSTNPVLTDATFYTDTIITDSSSRYTLPVDCMEIIDVSIVDPTKNGEIGIKKIDKDELGKNTSSVAQHIKYYALKGNQIIFDPNNAVDTVLIDYRPYAAVLDTNEAVSNVIKKYKLLVVNLAIIEFYGPRTGTGVAPIVVSAANRITAWANKLGIKPESVLPDIK